MISRSRYVLLNGYHILIDGLFDSVPIVLAFMALSFGVGETAVGSIVSAGAAAGTVLGLGTLFFSRRFGCLRTIALLTGLYGLGFFLAAFTSNIVTAGLCFVAAVAGHTIFHNISFSYLASHTERRKLGRILSDFTAIGDVGRIPLVSLAAFVAASAYGGIAGWKAVCLGYGIVALIGAFWLFFHARAENEALPEDTPPADTPERRFLPSFALLKNRELTLAMVASVLNAVSNDRIFTFLPLLLFAKGIDGAIISTFALGFTVGSFLGKMACGRLVDSFGARKVFVTAEVVLAVLVCALIAVDGIVPIIVIALLLGIVTKGTVPVIQAIITEPVPGSAYDDVFSINSFTRGIANMVTPLMFGMLGAVLGMHFLYGVMAVVALVAIVPVLMMRPVEEASPPE